MGAWGVTPFENDDALDWVAAFETQPTLDFLRKTLTAAIVDSHIEEDVANEVLAAATVVAALKGYKKLPLPQTIRDWVTQNSPLEDTELVVLAIQVTEHVLNESEAAEIWDDSGNETWFEGVRGLLQWLEALKKAAQ